MAKIVRYNGNLQAFASQAVGTERTLFGEVTQANDLTSQFTADFLRGWGIVGSSDQPTLEDFNGAMYTHGQLLAYLHQMGIAEYNTAQEYHSGSLCQTGGVLYISLVNSNTGNTPASSPSQWKAFIIPAQATELVAGILALASLAEAAAGADDTKAMTALKVKNAIANNTDGIAGAFSNFRASTTGLSAVVTMTADSVCVKDSSFRQKVLNAVSLSASLAASGLNGLDTGSSAANTWYYMWVIWNPTTNTTGSILSLSSTAPTMPSGYTYKARVGAVLTDSTANKFPFPISQLGAVTQYVPIAATNLTLLPAIAAGVQGTINSTGVAITGTSLKIPPTARKIRIVIYNFVNSTIQVSPTPNMSIAVGSPCLTLGNPQANNLIMYAELSLQSNTLYYAANAAAAANTASCFGWEDNL